MGNTIGTQLPRPDPVSRRPAASRCGHKGGIGGLHGSPKRNRRLAQHVDEPTASGATFLLYLIHKTWSVVVEHVDGRSRRSRSSPTETPISTVSHTLEHHRPRWYLEDEYDELAESAMCLSMFGEDPEDSLYGSQYSFCSCSHCGERVEGRREAFCESYSDFLYQSGGCFAMAPSAGPLEANRSPLDGPRNPPDVWGYDDAKDNQRPPVYNPEDYALSLRTWGRRPMEGAPPLYRVSAASEGAGQRIEPPRSQTLPTKYKDYRSPIATPPPAESEMTLRQFGSVSELLGKLRADLRSSYSSFVQEFVGSPLEGVTLLLEVLRAVQLSHSSPVSSDNTGSCAADDTTARAQQNNRVTPAVQRRALLDELVCLQCLSLCCARSGEAGSRLSIAPAGLLPLAISATGPTVKARLLALQLLTTACESEGKLGSSEIRTHPAPRAHAVVSEAMSTLRLQCGEPVRFRLLVGMVQSGGAGELQAVAVKFLNTFLECSPCLQQRLYIQAELQQAGFEPEVLAKSTTVCASTVWSERLRHELARWDAGFVDAALLLERAKTAERDAGALRNRVTVLERRVQVLMEEKKWSNSKKKRSTDCFDREIPVPTPRTSSIKIDSSGHEDEGISSSEADRSLSPDFPSQRQSSDKNKVIIDNVYQYEHRIVLKQNGAPGDGKVACIGAKSQRSEDDEETTIEEVIEELHNIVSDAERDPSWGTNSFENRSTDLIEDSHSNWVPEPPKTLDVNKIQISNDVSCSEIEVTNKNIEFCRQTEDIIIPARLLPNPPRKNRSLFHPLPNDKPQFYHKNREIFFDNDALGYTSDEGSDSLLSASKCLAQIPRVMNSEAKKHGGFYNNDCEGVCKIEVRRDSCSRKMSRTEADYGINRALLNAIMDARQVREAKKSSKKIIRTESIERKLCIIKDETNLGGVFYVDLNEYDAKNEEMIIGSQIKNVYQRNQHFNAMLEARKRTKSLDRIDDGLDTMVDIVLTSDHYTDTAKNIMLRSPNNSRQIFLPSKNTVNIGTTQSSVSSKTNSRYLFKRQTTNAGLYSGTISNGKLTDLTSGLY